MWFVLVTPLPKDGQFFPFQGMMWASDGDIFGEMLVVVGSVLWGPSITSIKAG
jgi:hypothetical protein